MIRLGKALASAIAALSLLPAASAHGDDAQVASTLRGRCWTRETSRGPTTRSPVSKLTYCMKRRGQIDGFWFDAGDGGDLRAHWTIENDKLVVQAVFEEDGRAYRGDRTVCDVEIGQDRRLLIVSNCDLKGEWHRDERMAKAVFGKR